MGCLGTGTIEERDYSPMKKFKLLFLDFEMPYLLKDVEYPVGGACVRQLALANGLISLGHKVGILTWQGANQYVDKDLGFELVESYSLTAGIKKLRFFYYHIPSLFRVVREYRPDFIFQKCPGVNTAVMSLISRVIGVPFIYMAGNDIDADGRYNQRLKPFEGRVYEWGIRNAAMVMAQNSYQSAEFKKRFNVRCVRVLHNPIYYNYLELHAIRNIKDRNYIAWLGVFQPQKNLPLLLDIVRRVPRIEFRIAGMLQRNASLETRTLLKMIESQENVKMVGYLKRTQVLPFLSNALALLSTSLYEGFPNTFLESWLAGTPVISRAIDPDGIIKRNSIGSVAEHADEIVSEVFNLRDFPWYDSLANRCRRYVIANHDPKIIAERFINCLQ